MQPVKEITINGITFKLKFGLKVSRLLGEKWGLDSFDEVLNKIMTELNSFSEGSILFSKLDFLYEIIITCVSANEENTDSITKSNLEELFDEDLEGFIQIIKIILTGYTESLPKINNAVPEKKPKALRSATHSPGTK